MAHLRSTVDPRAWRATHSSTLPLLIKRTPAGSTIRRNSGCACIVCGAAGRLLYEGLEDRLFGASGHWTLMRCERADCGMVWLNPLPDEEDLGRAYANYYTHRRDAEPLPRLSRRIHDFVRNAYLARAYGYHRASGRLAALIFGWVARIHPARRAIWDFSVMMLPRKEGGRLLDIGCGSGAFLKFARELGWAVEGVDPDPSAVRAARGAGLRVHAGDLTSLAFPRESFDAVTMSHVIEHVPDPLGMVREVLRILRPGGAIAVVTPNSRSFLHRWFRADWRGLEPPRHLQLFTRSALTRTLVDAGFHIDRATTGIRDANNMYVASYRLRTAGHHEHGDRGPWALRLRGHGALMLEWISLWRDADAGEEITIIGRK